ncbi:MAG TPA: hypothetical protein VGA50_07970 [Kiloniellales bacterium]
MSVSEFPIPKEEADRRQTQSIEAGEDRRSPRFGLLIVVLSGLILWSGIFVMVSWIF